jgi:hypothetical protein
MHERQAVVFGVLLATLAVVGLGAAAVYTGSLNLPFVDEEFLAEPTPTVAAAAFPCPPEGSKAEPYGVITVNVYNTTGTSGLAATTMDQLVARDFKPGTTGNLPEYPGTAQVITGPASVARAYTLAAQVEGARLVMDGRTGGSVDLVLGVAYTGLLPPEQITLDPDAPLESPPGCTPFDRLVEANSSAKTPATDG